jgi:hypothetical protein
MIKLISNGLKLVLKGFYNVTLRSKKNEFTKGKEEQTISKHTGFL